jgi:pyruvate dehydrogenase E2 component (dihydrolipoamide acetyltransferase)
VSSGAPFEETKASTMRKVIAKRLTASKAGVPHMYASAECELDAVLAFRKKLAADHGVKVSVNDFVIRCAALALRDVPELNASWDDKRLQPQLSPSVDVSVAVATPGGLITPIVTGAHARGLADIGAVVGELAGRAREGKLQPHEYQGGTFSVSNLGSYGVAEFSAVVNPPQAVIMAVGGGVRTVKPGLVGEDGVRAPPRGATVMTARVSVDRRVGDEALAGQFLQAFQLYMNQPHVLHL